MTKNARSARRRPADPGDLRLYIAAILALAYLIAWWAFAPRGSNAKPDASAPPPATRPVMTPPSVQWYGQLAPSQRPALSLPPGWQIVTTTPPAAVVPAPRMRVLPAPPPRIRTRSS